MRILVCLFVLIPTAALATDKNRDRVDVDVDTHVPVDVQVPVELDVPVTVETPVHVDGTEVNSPVHVESPVTTEVQNINSVPKQVPNAWFNYTPNYLNCGRVLGFQFGNTSGIGSLGIPLPRDRSCDIWLAVNEAQENGHILLSYAFMCEIRHIKEVWGKARCNEITDTAGKWWEASLGGGADEMGKTEFAYETVADPFVAQIDEERVETLEKDIEELELLIEQQQVENRRLTEILQRRAKVIDDGAERRRRALEELKKGGYDPEEKEWQKKKKSM